ncbi:MAG TPA: CHASE3 domain-containing protein [Acidobacteriaceae bacterium]|nr:CHASE3 domain-containing protein [Acidobacteriaceae bacterium]
MQLIYKRFGVITGFVLLLILLLVNALITRHQLADMVSHQADVEHTQQVLIAVNQAQSLLKDAETGQRGFLYTNQPSYLEPYNLALTQLPPQLRLLQQLTSGDPTEQAEVAQLRSLTQAKLAELSQTVLLYRTGQPDAARTLVLSDRGRLIMVQIDNLIGKIQLQEASLAAARTAAARRSIRNTVLSIYLASLVAAIGLFFLAYFITKAIALHDIYARQLEEREEWFRSTLTGLGDAVIATDGSGHVTFLNSMAEKLMGTTLSVARGKYIENVFPIFNETTLKPVDNPVKKVMENGLVIGLANHTVLLNTDGTYVPIEDSAAPIRDGRGKIVGVVLVFRDATTERKSQEVLRKTEKLAAAARLAATVAHEINNPLEAIGNLIYLSKAIEGLPESAFVNLSLAEQELSRVSHITRQTLGFYRESKEPNEVDLPTLVEAVLNIYSNKFRTKNITIVRDFHPCPPIQGLSGELNQAVANLVSNAADAVPHGGTICVRIDCHEDASSKTVNVTVEDDGPGIAPEHRDRIFEPFFTTKKDVGTGLGLWVTKEIIERHSGTVEVRSSNDTNLSGTAFSITLPVRPDFETILVQAPNTDA